MNAGERNRPEFNKKFVARIQALSRDYTSGRATRGYDIVE